MYITGIPTLSEVPGRLPPVERVFIIQSEASFAHLLQQGGTMEDVAVQGVLAAIGRNNVNMESAHHNSEALEYCEVKMESLSDHEGEELIDKVVEHLQNTKVKIKDISTQKSGRRQQHMKSATFSCDQCAFIVASRQGLLASRQGLLASRQGLLSHKKSKHDGVRFPCGHCVYASSNKSDLKKHKVRMHSVDPLSLDEINISKPTFTEAVIKLEENVDDPLSLTDTTENRIVKNEYENIVIRPVLTDIKKEPS